MRGIGENVRPNHSPLLELRTQFQLLPTEQGGRRRPIVSGYRPDWDLGNTWLGEPTINGGQVLLLGVDELRPGDACEVRIEPLAPEFWCAVRVGSVIATREGSRVVGHATVLAVGFPVSGFSLPVGRFAAQAWQYCAFVEQQAQALGLDDRLRLARIRLLELYRTGVDLPVVEVIDGEDNAPFTMEPPSDWPGFGAHDLYWEVFDPYEDQAPVCGGLSDDVIDVYLDVARGLRLWRAGRWLAAAWEWRFSFHTHWGDHVMGAMRALDRALREDFVGARP